MTMQHYSPHLLALRPISLVLIPVLLLLVVGTPQQPDPLLTLLLSHCKLVDIALHVPSPKQVRLHSSGLLPFTVYGIGEEGRKKIILKAAETKVGQNKNSGRTIGRS